MTTCSLVTGGAGFIGSHVAAELLSAGHRVVVLDNLSGGNADNVPPGASLVVGSILDHGLVEALFREHAFDFVFHLAAYAAEGLSPFIKRFNYENNLIGSVNVLNAAVNCRVQCFVFTSSMAVYGTNQLPFREETAPQPQDSYGIAKHAVERELAVTQRLFGLDYVIFRPHNVYGERQNIGDRYRNVVGIFMNQIMQGKPMTLFGDGSQSRAFSYISDVAPIIARSVTLPAARNQIFNLGGDAPCTIQALAEAVAAAMGVAPRTVHLPPRHEVQHAYCAHDKYRAVFAPGPGVALADGLARMARWARRVGPRRSRPFAHIEIPRGLPPSWLDEGTVEV